jgi:hypothetical protein
MDQADDLRNKFVDIDRVGGGDSLVDETVDSGIETRVDVSDGSMDDGTDSNCKKRGQEDTKSVQTDQYMVFLCLYLSMLFTCR